MICLDTVCNTYYQDGREHLSMHFFAQFKIIYVPARLDNTSIQYPIQYPNTKYLVTTVVVVVVEGQGGTSALDVGHIVGPLNYSRCDTIPRLPCTITPFY